MFIANLTKNFIDTNNDIDILRFISLVQLLIVKPPPSHKYNTTERDGFNHKNIDWLIRQCQPQTLHPEVKLPAWVLHT